MKRTCLILLVLALACILTAAPAEASAASGDPLTYTLMEDGNSCSITGCDPHVSSVVIPAAHDGLPVLSIAGDAFIDCKNLESFRTEEGQPVFYAEDGVLFTDDPVKTLVRFPNAYPLRYYQAPEGTKAIAPWAFAGVDSMWYVHFRDGLESIGDYAFTGISCSAAFYFPDSVTDIGGKLLQNQTASVAFYGSETCRVRQYSYDHEIPYGLVLPSEKKVRTVQLGEPDLADAEGIPEPDPAKIYTVPEAPQYVDYDFNINYWQDLSSWQDDGYSELRINLQDLWSEITPDAEGNTLNGMDPRTGLYGIGTTGSETVLRGYGRDGSVTGVRVVNGDFMFFLPGAYSLGVSGGSGTSVSVLPYEPVIVASRGDLPVDPSGLHQAPNGVSFQEYFFPFGYTTVSTSFPIDVSVFSYSITDARGLFAPESSGYAAVRIRFDDPILAGRYDQVVLEFDCMQFLFENESISCYASSRFGLDESFGLKMAELLETLQETMSGVYFPEDIPMNRVTVRVNGSYPNCDPDSVIELDESLAEYTRNNVIDYVHEMTHAVDYSLGLDLPSAWMEGRAEYISRKVCSELGIYVWQYEQDCDWSFLSEEDRADFFRYYTESVSRETTYTVGYYFFRYLCDTYGEDVSAKIMQNLADTGLKNHNLFTGNVPAHFFKKSVTEVTDPDVFQNFIRDVVEKK